jgi:hypothetical protein
LITVAVLRIAVAILATIAPGLIPPLDPAAVDAVPGTGFAGRENLGPPQGVAELLLSGLERWDALWYLAIAEYGYPRVPTGSPIPEVYAFFPLFPLIVGGLGRLLLGNYLLAANLVAFAAAVAGLAGIHRLVEVERGDDPGLADRAALAIGVFPAAYFLVAPYPEGLFLALSAWALVAVRRGVWGQGALLAATAALARPVGVLLAVALVAEAVRQHREGRPLGVAVWPAFVAAPAGAGAFFLWAYSRTGVWTAPLTAQEAWLREATWPHETVWSAVRLAVASAHDYPGGYLGLDLLLFLPVVAAVVWLVVRTPPTYGLYAVAHLVAWLVTPFPGRPLMSTYRFALGLAPLGWAFAAWTRRPPVAQAWWAVSGALLGIMTALFLTSYYVF